MNNFSFSGQELADTLRNFREKRPLVHCLTNEVVQEITANVLLAAGASPAMVVAKEEAALFAGVADALLINIGTPYADRLIAMHESVNSAEKADHPWVLDPVAAGGIPWRDGIINEFVIKKPSVIRGNASEILAVAGMKSGGKGVDSTDSSETAVIAAQKLALEIGGIVCVTGEKDFVTDGTRVCAVEGGHPMATLVVGTGCSLSALVAAFCSTTDDPLLATVTACSLAKKAGEKAFAASKGPGSFHNEYLDALYNIKPEDFL